MSDVIARLAARLRALRHWRRRESDLDEEIGFHLAADAAQRRAAGDTAAAARDAARREFGSLAAAREATRESWGWSAVERILQDLRYGVRVLRATPVVSAVAIGSLALGIGANTAIFSVLDTLMLRALPVDRPGALVVIGGEEGRRPHWTNPIWEAIRDRPDLFDGAFAVSSTRFNLAVRGETTMVDGMWVSGAAFDVLGVPAFLGRLIEPDDDRPGGGARGPVAVISYGFWQRRFGGRPDVVGQSLTVDRVAMTIVGVTPPQFFGVEVGRTFDVALPVGVATLVKGPNALRQRSSWWLRIVGRLKPGDTVERATARLRGLQPQIRAATLPTDWHESELPRYMATPFRLEPAANGDSALRQRYQRPIVTIMAVVALVLLIACTNLANLLLARASARRQEISLRLALGASRARVARQLLTESLLLSTAGAALGLLLAHWGSRLLVRQLSTQTNTVFLDLALDWRVLGFTAAVAIVTAMLFGTAPALRGTRVQPHDALRAQGRSLGGDGRHGAGYALVVVQVALSLVLLTGAGLFLRTFAALANRDLGFDSSQVAIAQIAFPADRIPLAERPALYRRIVEAAAAVPGVASVGLSQTTPLGQSNWNNAVEVAGLPLTPVAERLSWFNQVTVGWLRTYGTPLIAGRGFTSADTPASPPVAIVNEAFARRFNHGRNPIGLRVRHPRGVERTVVGYVKDAVYENLRDPVPPTLYIAYEQETQLGTSTNVSVRVSGGSAARVTRPLVAALTQVHPDLVITPRLLADDVRAFLTQERVMAGLSALFGALALALAALGLYGVTSYGVTRRRAEIGVRLALGAAPSGVVRLILRRALALVALGIVGGSLVSLWLARFVSPLLFGLQPRDPATLVGAIALLGAIGGLAAWLPARRAARIDPTRVLRES